MGDVVHQLELSTATVDCRDAGGDGPVVVLLHGLLMDASLWDGVVADLAVDHRCVVPTLPLGAHRRPVCDGADPSLAGVAGLVIELLDGLDLKDVTLVGNDTGGALVQLVLAGSGVAAEGGAVETGGGTDGGAGRVGRAVLVSCEAFDNLPPGLTGRTLALASLLSPSLFGLFMQQTRVRVVRRLPITFGWLTKTGDAVTAGWLQPLLTRPAIRRDTVRMLRAVFADRTVLTVAAKRLSTVARPVLVVWATQDRVMPPDHGRRLAALLPKGRLVEVDDSYTLVPLDQPAVLARHIRSFVAAASGNVG